MLDDEFLKATLLLLIVLNPFALSVYLVDIFQHRNRYEFLSIVGRASMVSGAVFMVFAYFGPRLFTDVLQVSFEAFQVFGGILFLLVALRFMLSGGQDTLVSLRGEPGHVAGAVALPFMIGPGTVSAAAAAGMRQAPWVGVLSVACALGGTLFVLFALKVLFDSVRERKTKLVERYIDLASRISAMIVGSIAVDMIFRGVHGFLKPPLAG